MPYFYTEAEIDVDVHEFLDSCSNREIVDLIKELKDRRYLDTIGADAENRSLSQIFHEDALLKLQNSFYQLSNEEIETIQNIAKKY